MVLIIDVPGLAKTNITVNPAMTTLLIHTVYKNSHARVYLR
jgi:hypothetical protein